MNTEAFTVESVVYAPATVVCKKDAGVYLLLDPDTPNWVIVDDIGKSIIELCDGKRTMKEIIEILCEKYNEPYEESVDDVLTFANELKEKQFLQKEKFPSPYGEDKKNASLEELWIHVTNQCNLQCMHCHLSSGLPLENELTKEEIYQIIEEAAELGVKSLVVTGGEPLLRKDILEILAYRSQNLEKVDLITNGTFITEGIAKKLKDLNINIQVSLDGAREETHDFIRGEGSYKKTIEGIKNLAATGVNTWIAMALVNQNLNEISEMATLVKKLGIKYLSFPILHVKGRAKENESVVVPQVEDIIAAFKKMDKISKEEDIIISSERSFRIKIEEKHKIDLCGAGSSVASIAADGRVYPCAALHEDEFCCGNIRKQPLKDIWEKSEIVNRFKSFSVLDIPECQNCELKFICGGGCHARKYYAYGQLNVPTPLCILQKKLYWHLLFEKIKEV